jgi:DUF4097 and DUF4098 domain-containing protein YvlB
MQSKLIHAATYSLALLAASASWAADVFDKQFAVQANETLVVDTDAGSVEVVGSEDAMVKIHAEMEGNRDVNKSFKIDATHENGAVRVTGRRDADWMLDLSQWFGSLKVKYVISVPQQFKLDIKTSGGNLNFRKLQGQLNARTSGGNVRVDDVQGDIDIHTSGGGMQTENTKGELKLRSSGGSITVRNAVGRTEVRTSGGNLRFTDIEGNLGGHTSGGNIEVAMVGKQSNIDIHTSGGNISVAVPRNWPMSIDAATSGGRIYSDLPVTSTGEWSHRRMLGTINGGGQGTSYSRLFSRTSGGNISIRSN